MTVPNTPITVPKKSQEAIIKFQSECLAMMRQHWNLRTRMEQIDRQYQREVDYTKEQARAKASNLSGNPNELQNITVPVVMPAVEAAVTYQASVFLTGNPIFGVVSSPESMDAARQMESLIEDQQVRGGWIRELIMFLRDADRWPRHAMCHDDS